MINIDAQVAERLAALEAGTSVTAGSLLPETFARQVADATMRSGSQENYLSVFSKLINMARRDADLSIEQLSERAAIDPVELLSIEESLASAPEPRVVSKLARALRLPSGKLMQLVGHLQLFDTGLSGAAVRFAAQSGSLQKLSRKEKGALNDFVKALTED